MECRLKLTSLLYFSYLISFIIDFAKTGCLYQVSDTKLNVEKFFFVSEILWSLSKTLSFSFQLKTHAEASPHPAFAQSLCEAQTKVCSEGTNLTPLPFPSGQRDKVTEGARLEKEALLLFLTRQVSSERSFPWKASSEGRTFVTNKVGNLGKPGLCKA